jgi:hypothetical protein
LALAALTVVLRIPALLASRHLTFDDGVYGASAVAMRSGGVPFRDVFSSQGPVFLPLVWAADLLGLRTFGAPRLLALLSAVALVLATWAMGRGEGDRTVSLLAAGLVATSGSMLFIAGPVSSDAPALAFAALAVAAALRYRDDPTLGWALTVGALTGAALMVKALVIPVVVPVGLILLLARRWGWSAAAVGAALVVGLIPSLLFGFADVWDQSVAYHLEVAGDRTPLANLGKVISTFATRDALVLAVAVVALGTVAVRRQKPVFRRTDGQLTGGAVLGMWLATILVVLALEHPLWRPHVAHLVVPVALLAALARPPLKAVAAALVVAAAFWFAAARPMLWPPLRSDAEAEVVGLLEDLPDGALVISDDPGVVWGAGRETPPDWVDGSVLLIESGRLDEDTVVARASEDDVCAVVVWSGERWGSFDGLAGRLAEQGYQVAAQPEDHKVLYLKEPCEP